MTTQHTPGPWKRRSLQAQRIITTGWHIEDKDGASLAVVLGDKSEELHANARLIAAAPELLDLVIRMRDKQVALRNGGLPRDEAFEDEANVILDKVKGAQA